MVQILRLQRLLTIEWIKAAFNILLSFNFEIFRLKLFFFYYYYLWKNRERLTFSWIKTNLISISFSFCYFKIQVFNWNKSVSSDTWRVGGLLATERKYWLKTSSRQQIGYMLSSIVWEVSVATLHEASPGIIL